jgi:hypothetical protein
VEPVSGGRGPLVCLPGGVPVLPRLGAFLAGLIEDTLGGAEMVVRGVIRGLGPLHRGQGIGERILGRGQPAA